jgi:putative AdoMet-dependent methyltransferase
MRSKYVDIFNHDNLAEKYNDDVKSFHRPTRVGYYDVLNWVIDKAMVTDESRVLELGSGSGNLSSLIGKCGELICVDISEKMIEIAKPKLTHIKKTQFIKSDILEYFDYNPSYFDVIISTYAIHHLTSDEKLFLLTNIADHINWDGRVVFGDLMFENKTASILAMEKYSLLGDIRTCKAIENEFFWYLDSAEAILKELGFQISIKRFSELSFGIAAVKYPMPLT